MGDLWAGLPVLAQDVLLLGLLLLPLAGIAVAVLRGFSVGPLVGAMLARFRWPVAAFVTLVALSVGTGIGLIAQDRAIRVGTAEAADGFDLVVAAPGSEITMLMAAVFLQPSGVQLLDGAAYDLVEGHEGVALAAPLAFGDSVGGAPLVGTTAQFARHLSDSRIEGRMWQTADEAVVGALSPLSLGDVFEPAHGHGNSADEGAHAGLEIRVVGRMAPTGSPWDRAVLVPVESVWIAHGLADGHAPGSDTTLGPPFDPDYFPGTPAIVVQATSLPATYALRSTFQGEDGMMAFFPGAVLSRLHGLLGDVRRAMSILSLATQATVAASVLTGLLLLTRLISRQMALLRAVGAPPRYVFAVVWSFATVILCAGAVLGVGTGLAASAVLSRIIGARMEIAMTAAIGWPEIHLTAAFASLSSAAALIAGAMAARGRIVAALRR